MSIHCKHALGAACMESQIMHACGRVKLTFMHSGPLQGSSSNAALINDEYSKLSLDGAQSCHRIEAGAWLACFDPCMGILLNWKENQSASSARFQMLQSLFQFFGPCPIAADPSSPVGCAFVSSCSVPRPLDRGDCDVLLLESALTNPSFHSHLPLRRALRGDFTDGEML